LKPPKASIDRIAIVVKGTDTFKAVRVPVVILKISIYDEETIATIHHIDKFSKIPQNTAKSGH